jgi:hypothetical protein
MSILNVEEIMILLRACGRRCNKHTVEQWLMHGKLKGTESEGSYTVEEEEVYKFLNSYKWEGTAYEKGLDDKTKVSRLLEDLSYFRQKIKELENENRELKEKLSLSEFVPF